MIAIINNDHQIWFKSLESLTEEELKDLEGRLIVGLVPPCDMFDAHTPMKNHIEGIEELIAKMNSDKT